MTTDGANSAGTDNVERFAVRTAGVFDPDRGEFGPGVVVVVAGDTIEEVRDDVPADVPVAVKMDGYVFPGLVDAHSHATIKPWDGDQMTQLRAHRTTATVRASTISVRTSRRGRPRCA